MTTTSHAKPRSHLLVLLAGCVLISVGLGTGYFVWRANQTTNGAAPDSRSSSPLLNQSGLEAVVRELNEKPGVKIRVTTSGRFLKGLLTLPPEASAGYATVEVTFPSSSDQPSQMSIADCRSSAGAALARQHYREFLEGEIWKAKTPSPDEAKRVLETGLLVSGRYFIFTDIRGGDWLRTHYRCD